MVRRSFITKNKSVRPMGTHSMTGRGATILPIGADKKLISHHLGMVSGSGTTPSLLSSDLATSSIGMGFGVKTPNKNLINKLENLSIGNKRKNVRLVL